MQFCTSARLNRFTSYSHRNIWLVFVIACLLLAVVGCGGSPSSPLQSQAPVLTPAAPSDPPPSSGSGSSGSGSSPQSSSGSSSSLPPGVPQGAQVIAAIQSRPNWQWCTKDLHGHTCASGLGNATSSMSQGHDTPSLTGDSAKFKIGGDTHYSNALWWKSLDSNGTPKHFVYDVYFYMEDPGAPEALEFDVNQSMNGTRYVWGSECSYRDTGHWDIWNDETGKWETTDVPCPVVSANEWHHLTWQIERVNGKVHYISVTLDDKVATVDKYYNPQQHFHGAGLSVAFQMDGDYRQDPYSVWLDKVSLSAW